jgi:hypothetical protein
MFYTGFAQILSLGRSNIMVGIATLSVQMGCSTATFLATPAIDIWDRQQHTLGETL